MLKIVFVFVFYIFLSEKEKQEKKAIIIHLSCVTFEKNFKREDLHFSIVTWMDALSSQSPEIKMQGCTLLLFIGTTWRIILRNFSKWIRIVTR